MITFSHVSKEYTTEDGKTRVYDDFSEEIQDGEFVVLMMIVGRWGILRKAGKKGWHSLIPLLNVYKEYSTVWNGWFGVLAALCLPVGMICNMVKLPVIFYHVLLVVGFLISIPESLKLAKAFGKGKVFGVLLALPVFKEIGRLILGLGKARFQAADADAAAV